MSAEQAKLNKDELKEDEFIEWVMRAADYVRHHAQYFLAGAGAVVAIVLIVTYVSHSQEQARETAAGLLGDALIADDNGQQEQAASVAQQLIDKYSGTPAATQALVLLANKRFDQGNFAEARTLYQKALSAAGDNQILRFGARSGLAACMDAEGNTQGAAAEYEKYAADYPGTAEAAESLLAAARCYERLGQTDARKGVLRRVVHDFNELPIGAQARQLLDAE